MYMHKSKQCNLDKLSVNNANDCIHWLLLAGGGEAGDLLQLEAFQKIVFATGPCYYDSHCTI